VTAVPVKVDTILPDETPAQSWFIAQRRQQVHAESLANLLRLASILAFSLLHLAAVSGIRVGPADLPVTAEPDFHRAIIAIAVAWLALAVGVHCALALHVRPQLITYGSIAVDLLLLVLLLCVTSGPRSPLVAGFFLIMALAAMRYADHVVAFATLGSLAGYHILLIYTGRVASTRDLTIPGYQQLTMLAALAHSGLILKQPDARPHPCPRLRAPPPRCRLRR
jgi:hypothetical protein